MNDENLVPLNRRSKRVQREIQAKGREANKVKHQRKKAMKALAKELMALPVSGKHAKDLKKMGVEAESMNNSMLMLVSMLQAALDGNVRAAEFLQNTMGESPSLELKKKELALKEKALDMKQRMIKGLESYSVTQETSKAVQALTEEELRSLAKLAESE